MHRERPRPEFPATVPSHLWVNRWTIFAVLAVGSFVLGFLEFREADESADILTLAYRSAQLFFFESGDIEGSSVSWELDVARFMAPLVTAAAAVTAVYSIASERVEWLRIWLAREHVVICGLGEMGLLLVQALREERMDVVVIEREPANELIEEARLLGALVIVADARREEVLRRAGVARASHLIAVCGSDGSNAEVVIQAREISRSRERGALTCIAHIVDPRVCLLMRAEELSSLGIPGFRLDFFNVFESGAHTLMREHPPFRRDGQTAAPHMLIIGLGRLGQALVMQAAREWKNAGNESRRRLRVTVVDDEASRKLDALANGHPELAAFLDLAPIDLLDEELKGGGGRLPEELQTKGLTSVYVCESDDSRTLATGLSLHKLLREQRLPIVLILRQSEGLAALLSGSGGLTDYKNLYAFGLLDRTLGVDLLLWGTHEVIARAMHEEYVAEQSEKGATEETNPAMAPWERLPEHLKESNRSNAGHIGVKLRKAKCTLVPLIDPDAETFEFTADEVELLAEMEHERWMDERERDGWKHAPGPKDIEKKTSPDLVEWTKLKDEVKEWDRVFVRGLPKFLARTGFQIVRLDGTGRSVEASKANTVLSSRNPPN